VPIDSHPKVSKLGHMSAHETANRIPEWTLGDRLRKARESAGLSQGELADRIGVARATVSSAERAYHGVRRITLNAWSATTGVPLSWIQGEGTERPLVAVGERRTGLPDRRVRHQGLEPRTRWFSASPTVEARGQTTDGSPERTPLVSAA
jgi:transcriptional regulator with XRE-family HTH domain